MAGLGEGRLVKRFRRRTVAVCGVMTAWLVGAPATVPRTSDPHLPVEFVDAPRDQDSAEARIGVEYLANAGFLLKMGSLTVLLDGVFVDGLETYSVPDTAALFSRLRMDAERGDSLVLLASHVHGLGSRIARRLAAPKGLCRTFLPHP